MLAAEPDGQIIGAGFAFRKASAPECGTATLRNVNVLPPHDGIGIEHRLIRRIEQALPASGSPELFLGGPRGAERQFFLSMGSRGRREGGFMGKAYLAALEQLSL